MSELLTASGNGLHCLFQRWANFSMFGMARHSIFSLYCVLDTLCDEVQWVACQFDAGVSSCSQHCRRWQLSTAGWWVRAAVQYHAEISATWRWVGHKAWCMQSSAEECQSATLCALYALCRQHSERGNLCCMAYCSVIIIIIIIKDLYSAM